jgi:hypothetical protein
VLLEFPEVRSRNGEARGALGLVRVEELARTTLLEHVTGFQEATHSRSVGGGDVFGEVASRREGVSVAILVPASVSTSIPVVTVSTIVSAIVAIVPVSPTPTTATPTASTTTAAAAAAL